MQTFKHVAKTSIGYMLVQERKIELQRDVWGLGEAVTERL